MFTHTNMKYFKRYIERLCQNIHLSIHSSLCPSVWSLDQSFFHSFFYIKNYLKLRLGWNYWRVYRRFCPELQLSGMGWGAWDLAWSKYEWGRYSVFLQAVGDDYCQRKKSTCNLKLLLMIAKTLQPLKTVTAAGRNNLLEEFTGDGWGSRYPCLWKRLVQNCMRSSFKRALRVREVPMSKYSWPCKSYGVHLVPFSGVGVGFLTTHEYIYQMIRWW